MSMKEGETLKNYSDRYFEIYNEIDGDFEDIAVRTFKVGLPIHYDLWKSLTMKLPRSMPQLMDRIEKHKRIKDNQNSSKGKAKAFTPDRRDSSSGRFTSSQSSREFFNQASHNFAGHQAVNSVFKEPPDIQGGQPNAEPQRSGTPSSSLRMINVIFAASRIDSHSVSGVMMVSSQMEAREEEAPCKKPKILEQPILRFFEEDKEGIIQPHNDALVLILQIAGYDVKRVMVDRGSRAEIIYPDLFKGLGLRA
ncbi:uncharacterized protein LOC142620231 [Castanea sativa]|uniref:uncharacterized protein LOC142620231 n=1 Tax=Castanea sativa TaxID=21020 RepID=UPI003F64BCCB